MNKFLNPETMAILDEMFDGVYVLDRSRKIVFWNRGAEQITGYDREKMLGLQCHEGPLQHEDEAGCRLCEHACPAERVMEHGNTRVEVVYLTASSGQKIPVETHVRALRDDADQVIGAIEVFRDVSHWKDVERLSEEKDHLMGILAHDLRNPLTVIQTYAKLLNHDPALHIREMSEPIVRRAQFALTLVDQLLDAKSIENGMPNLLLEPLDIGGALGKCRDNFTAAAEAKDIQLNLNTPDGAVTLLMDPVRFEEVFNNLIADAINYSFPKTKIDLTIAEEDGGAWIKVQDQGMGISPEDQVKLFKPFGKTHNRPTAGEGSHGLGLYIVKKIVELFKGEIRLESEPGRGTAVSVFWPRQQPPA